MSAPINLDGYTDFEKQLAIAWTQAQFSKFLDECPNAHINSEIEAFSNALEGSLYVIAELRKSFGG